MTLLLSPGNLIVYLLLNVLLAASCRHEDKVAMPGFMVSYSQPETVPLELTDPKPLHWDTLESHSIQPKVFPLDFDKIKSMPYDASGFQPFPKPVTSSFDFDKLPSNPFTPEKSETVPLDMNMKPLPLPSRTIKLQKPVRITTSTLDLREWKQMADLNVAISDIVKDRSGLLWIATTTGLYRFDGSDVSLMIPDDPIYSICLDADGNIWYFTVLLQNASIIKIDLKNKLYGKAPIPEVSQWRSDPALDKAGKIWITIRGGSILNIDPAAMAYTVLDRETGIDTSRYYSVAFDHYDRVWLASVHGIDIIDQKSRRVHHLTKANGMSDSVAYLSTGPDGRVWAGHPSGLEAVDIENGKINHYRIGSSNMGWVTSMLFDASGRLWLGSPSGLYIVDLLRHETRRVTAGEGLLYERPVAFLEDHPGNMVVAGYSSSTSTASIYLAGQYGRTVFPFKREAIISVKEDAGGNLWVGSTEGLYRVDSARERVWLLDESHGLAHNFIQTVREQNGNILICTDGGYNIYSPSKDQWIRFSRKEGLPFDRVYSVMTDDRDDRWITGSSDGIIKISPDGGRIVQLNMEGGLNGNYITQAAAVAPGKIWLLTGESGPNIIDVKTNTIRFIKDSTGPNSLSVKGLTQDSHGRIWISLDGSNGLYMVDPDSETLTHFTTRQGLVSNSTLSALEYRGKMLITTGTKVHIITPPSLSPSHQWETGVLRHSEYFKKSPGTYISDWISERGEFLWGDIGLAVIPEIVEDTTTAKVAISGVEVSGKDLHFFGQGNEDDSDTAALQENQIAAGMGYTTEGDIRWKSLSGPYGLPAHLSLPHDHNVIRFHFTELNTGRSDTVKYAYVLEGIDKAWSFTTNTSTDTYLNLTPGDYTFQVASRWKNGRWNTPALFSFTIRPPWYLTWWAYVLYFVAAASLLRLYILYRSRKLKEENKLLEAKVEERTMELQQSFGNIEKLNEIGKKITSSLSVAEIIPTVYDNVNALMDANMFGIGIYSEDGNRIGFPATYENGQVLPYYSNDLDDRNRLSVVCFREGKEIVINDLENQYQEFVEEIPAPLEGAHSVSLIYLPLTTKAGKMGVITVQSFERNAYSEYHLYMLRNIATYTAIALENANSYTRLYQSLDNLKTTQAQLIQSEKMASLGELTAGIAHEIQNPLNFVNNFSEVNMELISEMDEEIVRGNMEEVKDLASNIRINEGKIIFHGKRADGIVKSMLQHSRNGGNSFEPTDINNLCDEYLRLAFHGMRARDKSFNSGMETDFDDTIGKINIVPQDIGRVLLNLMTNAFYEVNEKRKQATPEYRPMVRVSTRKVGDNIRITVSDNGNGIPEEVRQKIFQPFFTTKPTGKGTGLGLSLSYDIVTKVHKGEISVDSISGESTTFTVIIPQNHIIK